MQTTSLVVSSLGRVTNVGNSVVCYMFVLLTMVSLPILIDYSKIILKMDLLIYGFKCVRLIVGFPNHQFLQHPSTPFILKSIVLYIV